MKLDTVTMLFAVCVVCTGFAVAMLLIWRLLLRKRALILWCCAFGCFTGGGVLILLRASLPLFITITCANLLVMVGYSLIWWGICAYREVRPPVMPVLGSLLLFLPIFSWFTYVDPDISSRMVILRLFIIFLLCGAIHSLQKNDGNQLTLIEKDALAALLLGAAFMLTIVAVQLYDMSYDEPIHHNMIAALSSTLGLVSLSVCSLAIILLTVGKAVDDLRAAESAALTAKNLLEAIVDNIPSLTYLKDREGRVLSCNLALARFFGVTKAEVLGKTSHDFFPEALANRQRADELTAMETGTTVEAKEFVTLEDGEHIYQTIKVPIHDEHGEISAICGITTDITAQQKYEIQLEYQTTHDELTGLANRTLLYDRLAQALNYGQRSETKVAVLLLDLDHFKEINDSRGHDIGDQLLCAVASRLLQTVRKVDTVARLGGDEFVIVLVDIAATDDVRVVAAKILYHLAEPYQFDDLSLTVTASLGVCLYPSDGEDCTSLLRNADMAMYRAKADRRNNFTFYSNELNE